MDVPQDLAEKLIRLAKGERIPASSLQYPLIQDLYNEEIIRKEEKRNNKVLYYIDEPHFLISYLKNINAASQALPAGLIETLKLETRQGLGKSHVTSNPLLRKRKLEGFFVASYETIETKLSGRPFPVKPANGISIFINDFNEFLPSIDTTIVGIESAENFKSVGSLKYLFQNKKVLFVFKHPHSNYLMKWLEVIPNEYIHFGDFDFFSLSIFFLRYKKRLGSKCNLFIPADLESQLKDNGKRDLYEEQLHLTPTDEALKDNSVRQVANLIHKYKKCLEQETLTKLLYEKKGYKSPSSANE